MTQKLKQWQGNMENNTSFCTAVTIFSLIFPCMNLIFFVWYAEISMYDFLFLGFYSVLFNILLFRKNIPLRVILILLNVSCWFMWSYVSLMGYWRGAAISLCSSVIPFFPSIIMAIR